MKSPTTVAVALLAGALFLAPAAAHAQNFQLLCRGPLNYAVGTGGMTTVVFIVKHTTSSGNAGISLQPGTCAWTDRPISAGEPTRIFVRPEITERVRAAFIAFAACAGDSRCVVTFLARNANDASNPHFRVDDGFLRVSYPAFP